jgi:hypothetical protein
MEEFVQHLVTNPWFILGGWAIGLLGLVGIPLGIFLHYRSKKERLPQYAVRNNNIIKGHKEKYPALKIHFEGHGEEISNLSISRLVMWNGGKETIKKQDVVKPGITVQVKDGCKILDVSVVQFTTDKNKFTITKAQDKLSATIAFDYCDKDEGAVFQIFHTGTSYDDLTIAGTIMGVGEPKRVSPLSTKSSFAERVGELTIFAQLLVVVVMYMIGTKVPKGLHSFFDDF